MIPQKDSISLSALCGTWHIDIDYGVQQFADYLHKRELMQSGASVSEVFGKKLQLVTAITETKELELFSLQDLDEAAIIELNYNGVMIDEDGLCSYGIDSLVKQLYVAYSNQNVKGILLNLYSGGGYSTSGYNLQQALLDKNKPVVVRTNFLGSAALNGALGASEIIAASEGAMIGSIGSYISIDRRLLNWFKENIVDIYAQSSQDKNKSFRAAIQGDFSALQQEADKSAEKFQKAVMKYRTLKEASKESTLSGGMFYASEAKSRGLVDAIGTRNFALKRVKSLNKFY